MEELRNILFTPEVVEFKKRIWNTLASDPLFTDPDEELSLEQRRELTFRRLKRVLEYEFLTDEELMECPMKSLGLMSALLPYDSGLCLSWQLSNEVTSNPSHCLQERVEKLIS